MLILRSIIASLVVFAPSVFGLEVVVRLVPEGQELERFGTAQAASITNVGDGDVLTILEVAASYWESVFKDDFVLTVDFGWFQRSGNTTATHRLVSEGGVPHRELSAAIAFDNDRSWFLDPTPWESSEFLSYKDHVVDGINVGREYTNGVGDASSRDLLSTALHEIGHALGLSTLNDAFGALAGSNTPGSTRIVSVQHNLSFRGLELIIDDDSAHLNNTTYAHALLRGSRSSGVRRLPSEVDILINSEISQFSEVVFLPEIFPSANIVSVDASGIEVEFLGGLESSPDLNEWVPVEGQSGSSVIVPSDGHGFFRSRF